MRPVAAGGSFRVVARDLRLSNGLVLPRGATISGSNLALLNNPLVWDQPERFMPVRAIWSPWLLDGRLQTGTVAEWAVSGLILGHIVG